MGTLHQENRCIDAHHHLWSYRDTGYAWMNEKMHGLRRDFSTEDIQMVASASGVTGTIVVEVERTAEETRWLTSMAADTSLILGVVGWADLAAPGIAFELEQIANLPKLKGIRYPIHDEPDPSYILRDDFNRGVSALWPLGLTYDVLIFEDHLPQTINFVDRHPNQVFIVDHIAKPRIRQGSFHQWRSSLLDLARRPNVFCKLSGMVTEADWTNWTPEVLAPYIDTVLEAFGPQRLMFGSDWPLVTLASSYAEWMQIVRNQIADLSSSERQWILWKTASEAYGLEQIQSGPYSR